MENNKFGHVMIDIETLGLRPDAIILAIAAVEFNLATGEIGRVFNITLDFISALAFNRSLDGDTLRFWLNQPKEVQDVVLLGENRFDKGMEHFSSFMQQFDEDTQIWSNGSNFDLVILKNAAAHLGYLTWMYWQERDVRTLVSLNPSIKDKADEFIGSRHNQLHDCLHQIKYCTKIYQSLYITNPV